VDTVRLAAFVALALAAVGRPAYAQPDPVIGGYVKVGEQRVTRTVTEFTYRATLTGASPLSGAAATVVSLSPATTIVDGTLTFGAAGAGEAVPSIDTFSFRHDRTTPFDWASLRWTIDEVPANQPPVANAGADQTVALGATVTLNGSGSTDADGNPLSFNWSLQSVPAGSGAALSNPSIVNPSFTIALAGDYVVRLVVSDGVSVSAPDDVVVSTSNSAPVANAGPDQTVVVGQTVSLDGSGSSDVDGNALTFDWSFVSRPSASAAALVNGTSSNPTFVADAPGAYELRLVVNDGQAGSAPDSVTITTQNSAPVADAGDDRSVSAGALVTLDGSGSTDVDGDALTYTWSLTSVPAGSAAALNNPASVAPTFTADLPGTYVAQLVVSDGTAASGPDTVTIDTQNSPPTANAGADQTIVAGQVVLLDGSASADPDGHPLSFQWSLTSAPTGSAAVLVNPASVGPSFTADQPGTYIVQLIVSDGFVNSAPDTATITTTNSVPVANAGPDRAGVPVGSTVTLDGSASTDADGQGLSFQWSLLTRPAGSSAVLSDVTAVSPSFVADVPGVYVAQLVVSDGIQASAPDTVSIAVDAQVVTIAATDDASEAGPDEGRFAVSRNGPTTSALTVHYALAGGATNGTDYAALASSIVIPAGSTSASIVVSPVDDAEVEGAESVIVTLSPDPSYVIGAPGMASLQIADDDLTEVSIEATDADAAEAGPATGTFTLTRTGSTSAPLTVLLTRGGTAADGTDFASLGGATFAVTIPAGDPSAAVPVTPLQDNAVEPDETVILTINPSLAYVVGTPSSATVTIADDPPVVDVTATDASASEAGPDSAVLTFTRSGGNQAAALTINHTVGGTATQGSDYAGLGGSVTIPANQPSATEVIAPIADNRVEGAESVILTIASSSSYTIGSSNSATATITDDPPIVTVVASDPDASETGSDPGVFTFSRTGGAIGTALTVFFSHAGTASEGTDYANIGGAIATVTIPGGQGSATVTISPLPDTAVEGPETAIATVQPNANYTIGAPSTATVTIADGNNTPVVTIAATDASANEIGPDNGVFTIARTGAVTSALVVNVTIGGTATNGTDYTSIAATATIPAGQPSATVTIAPLDEFVVEGSETVVLTLVEDAAYDVGAAASATVTIADRPVPTVNITASDATASEVGGNGGTFTLTRSGATSSALTVDVTIGGTASNGVDFTTIAASVAFAAGAPSATVAVEPINDALIEGTESVVITLVDGAEYNVGGQSSATVTIADAPIPIVTVTAPDPDAAESGPDSGTFTIARTGDLTFPLTVARTIFGSASAGLDYAAVGATTTIPAGQASVTVTIAPIDDAAAEGAETVLLTVTDTADYDVGTPATATVTILDDDLSTVTVQATDAAAAESGPDLGTFTFSRTGDLAGSLTVSYTVGGTATGGTDYANTLSTQVTFNPGQASTTRTLTPLLDALLEGEESVTIALTPMPTAYIVGTPAAATIAIADNVPTLTVSASDAAASEAGDTGTFTFTRTGDLGVSLSVFYVVSGTATGGTDYANTLSTQVTFNPGQASVTRTVTPFLDALVEGNETVTVALQAGEYLIGTPNTATVTIADSVPTITVAATDAAAAESGDDVGTFTFTRVGELGVSLTVLYTVGGTATAGQDYANTLSTQITFNPGQASVTRTVTPFLDALVEGAETVTIALQPGEYVIGTPGSAMVTIADSVPTISVEATDAAASESGDTGTFTFTRSGDPGVSLTVLYSVGGTATAGQDYTNTVSTQVTFNPGQTTATRTVTPFLDALVEGDESVTITLQPGQYVIGAQNTGTVTIADNVPTITLEASDAAAAEAGDTGTFTVTRTGALNVALTVFYTVGGTATAGIDYSNTLSTQVTFNPGQATATRTVTPFLDALLEGGETVTITLQAGQYIIGAQNTGTVTIADNVPTITVEATDAAAAESGGDTGTFTFTRTGALNVALTVFYTVGGTATVGTDYSNTLSTQVTFNPGQATATRTVTPIDDSAPEAPETVTLTLAPGQYVIGASSTATVTIASDE
jgi:hypothetical protein